MRLTNLLYLLVLFIGADVIRAEEQQLSSHQQSHYQNRKPSVKLVSDGVQKAVQALSVPPLDEKSVWDKQYLEKNGQMKNLIEQFWAGKVSNSVKDLDLSGKSISEIEDILTKKGFKLSEDNGDRIVSFGTQYRQKQKIYKHEDGGAVRIKLKGTYKRPQPQVIKAVLKDPKGKTSWDNEAFKVSNKGYPIPKSPHPEHGLKIHAPESKGPDEDLGWTDMIMEEAHPDISKK